MEISPEHYAHTLPPPNEKKDWEPLPEHLKRVAEGDEGSLVGAAGFAEAFGGREAALLLGWWHDLGKYSPAFQAYLQPDSASGDDGHRGEIVGRVDHSTAGAQHAAAKGSLGYLLAYCIAGHHAGLPNDEEDGPGLSSRLKKQIEPYHAAPAEILDLPMPPMPKLNVATDKDGKQSNCRTAFAYAFYTRMLFSCLVDADYLATEWFVDGDRASQRPRNVATPAALLSRLDQFLEEKQRQAEPTPVNAIRSDILDRCRSKAVLPPGFFSLNVPTGGGKTLSSLAFALRHAVANGLRRVVYAIPFTSIIEQTADVFCEAMGDLAGEVLEHHSQLEPDDPARQTERSRLAAENFDAPLIVTTNVQLFESMFASRTSKCRKLHRLAKSVIILDEAQALPPNLLAPTLAALDELVRNHGATVLLCTATQPAVERREKFPIGLERVTPIIDDPASLHGQLRRTRVELAGPLTNEELAARLRHERRVLCVVNSRRHAADVLTALGDPDAFHLSAGMCAAHRSDVIRAIRRRLRSKNNAPCRVVSTQVIEAGVDVDFPAVYRAFAGLDSVAQAAGRCNREGKLRSADGQPALGRVVVFDYDTKAYRTETMIQSGANRLREIAPDHAEDLLSPQAIEAYFRLHYWQIGGSDKKGWDQGRGRASVMGCFAIAPKIGLHAQFRDAADAYRLIDNAQTSILVPYSDRGVGLVEELRAMPETIDPKQLRAFDRRAQRYVVSVFDHSLLTLLKIDVLMERHGRFFLNRRDAYNQTLGLRFDLHGQDPETFIY